MTRQMVFLRPRYFSGQLLTAEDLATEQDYHRAIQRFRNLYTHGYGIVSGLSVQTGGNGTSVTVEPGYAIDGFGREICVPAALILSLPDDAKRLAVCVGYAESETGPTAVAGTPPGMDLPVDPSRIEEGFDIAFRQIPLGKLNHAQIVAHLQGASREWILLAILRRDGKRWRRAPLATKPHSKSQSTLRRRT